MKIDKARFLLITTAIASGAAAAVFGCSSSTESTATVADAGGGTDSATTTDSGGGTDASTTDASDAGPCLAANGDAGPDSGNALSDCAFLTGYCGPACESVAFNVTALVGDKIVECMQAKQADPLCQASTFEAESVIEQCTSPILDQLCPDPTTTAFCQPLVTTCNGVDAGNPDSGVKHAFTQANCEKYAAALTDQGRSVLGSCVAGAVDQESCSHCFVGWP